MAMPAETIEMEHEAALQSRVEAAEQDRVVGINGLPLELAQSDLLQQVDIIGIREGGLVECFVPFELIDNEEVPVKKEHALELANSFAHIAGTEGGTGQHVPVTLGFIPGEEKLKIMDGFHRSEGLRLRDEQKVYATVKLTDWDGLYDFRILTAKDHTHVRFSRVVQWIREVWDHSPLSQIDTGNGENLSVTQAIVMYRFESEGSKFNMDPEEVEAVKAWVAGKEHLWNIKAMTIYSYLKVAETVDPGLVHSTREKSRSDILEAPTQRIISIFADELPNNFRMQNLVMNTAKIVRLPGSKGPRSMTGPEIKALCQKASQFESVEAAALAIAKIDWNTWEPEYGETKQRALRRAHDPRHKGAAALAASVKEVASVRERVRLSVERKEDITESQKTHVHEAEVQVRELIGDLGALLVELAQLTGEQPLAMPTQPKISGRKPTMNGQGNAGRDSYGAFGDEHEGLEDIIRTPGLSQLESRNLKYNELVDACMRGTIEPDDVPLPITHSDRRRLRIALANATDIGVSQRVGNFTERFKELTGYLTD